MAIGRTNAGGAGGAALNFKVVPGLTQPGTAVENTIWVKTEKIGFWYFSATQPENAAEYDVWFRTGDSSALEFNALKKNGIQVYPISAKQYVSGAYVDVDAMSYQNGEWIDLWKGELYDAGDEYSYVTGGWEIKQAHRNYPLTTETKKYADHFLLRSQNNTSACFITNKKFDVSKFKTLYIRVTDVTNTLRFGLSATPTTPYDSTVATALFSVAGDAKFDLPSDGEYYIWIGTYSQNLAQAKIHKVWME